MPRRYKMSKRLEKSYQVYERKRKEFIRKGYALADKVSRREYEDLYLDAKDAGMSNNFARRMAYDDLRLTQFRAKELYKQMNTDVRAEYDIHSIKELRGREDVHEIITYMFDMGMIPDREEFEKSLGY